MKNQLYMAVSADKYELPLYVCESVKELGVWAGYDPNYISRAFKSKSKAKRGNMRFVIISMEGFK